MTAASNRPSAATLARYPIPIELISALFRADETEFDRLITGMPEYGRARIAAYCVERERLQPLGLRIARTCEEGVLVRVAGPAAGASLFTQSRLREATAH
ncbi:hypothetical protein [Methylobacterium symbioticum]|uniref:Uncharacterized protein n=1 Tax=Methylobacterium symbioticum TaxID=2584084 RepID=A0A509EHS3_9HYPH|nr:hypothetical protein [Methylobacterium symbioticum]VUD73927.1 hypothetical protein MET9862_04549 [Methylobacterium symbioticum]